MMCGKFNDALDDLINFQATTTSPNLNKIHTEALMSGERFYLPEAPSLIEGKLLEEDLKSVFKLPFGCISLLTKCKFDYLSYTSYKITIAFNLDGEQNNRFRWIENVGRRGWAVMSIVLNPIENKWTPGLGILFCEFPVEQNGMVFRMFDTPETKEIIENYNSLLLNDFRDDVSAVQNLCVMLTLHNVRTCSINAPKKLNHKRKKNGKRMMPDYKVLVVNGELWDSALSSGKDGDGYRSHMRRGHIRRLDDNRRVWVSSCFVRGRKDGFIDKEYFVNQNA